MNKGSQAYKQVNQSKTEDLNFDPHQTVQYLMQFVIEKLALAKHAIEANNIKVKGECLSQVVTILGILQASLDPQKDCEALAADLDNLYHYMMNRVLEASYKNSAEMVEEVLRLMNTIKSGWDAISYQDYLSSKNNEK